MSNLEHARRYLRALEAGAQGDTLAAFFTPDIVQEEFPNRLMEKGATRDLAALLDGAVRGSKVMTNQRFEIVREIADGDRVAIELVWTATTQVAFRSLAVGDTMRARFAIFIDYRDGRIARQRNYDCFDPF
jgi:ketosteroid isomerase-like protein